MVPECFTGKRRKWLYSISHEAIGGVGVQSEHERDEQVMCIPERLEGLLAYPMMCRGVHKKHTHQHNMAGDASSLRIVDLYSGFRPDLVPLDVEEVDIMGTYVDNREDQEGVSALAVKPLRLIQGQKPKFRSDESQQIPAHWEQYEQCVDRQHQSSSS